MRSIVDRIVLDRVVYTLEVQQLLHTLRVREGSGREAEVHGLIAAESWRLESRLCASPF